ncbi:MAG: 16S rRNA (cytosine(1402)-N(4))-methyltransferase RsmH [Firmicutes bacterium]|nr:16S rRNA (cytosine(1402)-N(4))-methyltransferase RsmH [Bacillota bacterium]
MNFEHVSVLFSECMEGLALKEGGTYVDCTLGGAGHSKGILERIGQKGTLIGVDQDSEALEASKERLSSYKNVKYVHSNFSNIKDIAYDLGYTPGSIDGFLLDLGVSSHQLDVADRGFSYNNNALLDMRMDVRSPLSAYRVVNSYSREQLTHIIWEYGEERWAKRIADFIIDAREVSPIETTGELVEVIKKAVPKGARANGPHPAKRTFQAIRIEVNNELGILEGALKDMAELLKSGGRICVITFHSLEDRIVKNTFRTLERPCTCPADFPVCVCGKKPVCKVISRKPVLPSKEEIEENPRSRSAKLRIAEKL